MKTYEEMARDVLKRRDEELKTEQSNLSPQDGEVFYPTKNKKRRLLQAVAIPCAAAIAVGAVTVGTRYGGLWGNGAPESEVSGAGAGIAESDGHADNSESANDRSDAPEKLPVESVFYPPAYGEKTRIIFLDEAPEYFLEHAWFGSYNFGDFPPHMDLFLTREELNSYFGVELDRLSKLHPDWGAGRGDGDYVQVYSGELTDPENSGDWMIDGRRIIFERSLMGYDPNGDEIAEILIQVDHVGFLENSFSPFDSSVYSGRFDPDNFSYINGRAALIYSFMNEDTAPYCDHAFEAVIDYGNSLVYIDGLDFSEDEFVNLLEEFTSSDNSEDDKQTDDKPNEDKNTSIIFLDEVPEYLIDPPHGVNDGNSYVESELFVPFTADELESYYGIDLGLFERLHSDWTVSYPEGLGIYVSKDAGANNGLTADDMTVGGRKVVSSYNFIQYGIGNYPVPTVLNVCFARKGTGGNMFSPFDGSYPDERIDPDEFSVINGMNALVYYDAVGAKYATIEMGDMIIQISAKAENIADMFDKTNGEPRWQMDDSEFLSYLDEFTRQSGEGITPWSEVSQDKFAAYIEN